MTRNEWELEIRKLRKKLRQIETLELLERDLSEDECLKVSRKKKVRDRLQFLLVLVQEENQRESEPLDADSSIECSLGSYTGQDSIDVQSSSYISSTSDYEPPSPVQDAPVQVADRGIASGSVIEEVTVKDGGFGEPDSHREVSQPQKRQVSSSVRDDFEEVKRSRPQHSVKPPSESSQDDFEEVKSRPQHSVKPASESSQTSSQTQPKEQKAKKKVKPSSGLASSHFQVTSCVGHNDLVVAVATDGEMMLSGSRDTTVKYWNVQTGREVHSFGGHTGTVTAVCLLTQEQSKVFCRDCAVDCELPLDDQERIGLSGSTDCTLKIWALQSGQLIRSIYTFNPITCLDYVSDDHIVIVATGGGKLELWDINTGQNLYKHLAHQNSVSSLKFTGTYVFSASMDGELQVYKYTASSLSCIYRSEELKLRGGGTLLCRPVHSLVENRGRIYYGDDGSSVKVLDWSEGVVSKFRNHVTEFGSTDALDIQAQTLFCSGYDLDVGVGYVNCRDLESGAYMCTLCDELSGRIVCLSCSENQGGRLVLVTGGLELKIWTQQTSSTGPSPGLIRPLIIPEYRHAPAHSDVESSGSSTDSDYEGVEESYRGSAHATRSHNTLATDDAGNAAGWRAWCHIL